jgi:hypothetical protein
MIIRSFVTAFIPPQPETALVVVAGPINLATVARAVPEIDTTFLDKVLNPGQPPDQESNSEELFQVPGPFCEQTTLLINY